MYGNKGYMGTLYFSLNFLWTKLLLKKKKKTIKKKKIIGSSLAVQLLRLRTFSAVGLGSVPGQETKIPQATWAKIIIVFCELTQKTLRQ